MPRERVYGDLTPFGEEDPRRTIAEVTWSREAEYVQLATIEIDGVTGDPSEIGSVEVHTPDGPVRVGISGGMYMQLNRRSINDLIRKLRRARDQAFGRDE